MVLTPKNPLDEYDLVLAAANNEEAYGPLSDYIKPLVEAVAEKYAGYPNAVKSTLVKEGFIPLHRAVKHYIEKFPQKDMTEYKFSTYYAWWARKWIEDSLGLENTNRVT